jgi:asparagine synthase (glutamine-hydrolysing)
VTGLVEKARRRSHSFGNTDNMRVVSVLSTQLLHEQFVVGSRLRRHCAPASLRVIDLTTRKENLVDHH